MPSNKERFFELPSFVVIGDSSAQPAFPQLTYRNLQRMGKRLHAVDLGGGAMVCGDPAANSLDTLPNVVGALVELPSDRVMSVVEQLVDAGIRHLWLHQRCETAAVLRYCNDHDVNIRWGSCAVMYTQQGFSIHRLHGLLCRLRGCY